MVLKGVNSPEYIEIRLELVLEDGAVVKQVGYSYTNGGTVSPINLSGYTIPATATREAKVYLRMAVKTPRSTQTQFQYQVSGTRVAASRAGRVVIA